MVQTSAEAETQTEKCKQNNRQDRRKEGRREGPGVVVAGLASQQRRMDL